LPFAKTTRRRMPRTPATPSSNTSSGTAVPTVLAKYSILPLAPDDALQLQ
jgi:hypothetical protein